VGSGEKRVGYVLVRNPLEAERDRERREEVLGGVREKLRKIGDLQGEPHIVWPAGYPGAGHNLGSMQSSAASTTTRASRMACSACSGPYSREGTRSTAP